MNLIRRILALTAAIAIAPLVTLAASACGGAPSATGPPTSGLEKKSPADVLQRAAGALKAAKSVHIAGTSPSGHVDARIQRGSAIGTLTNTSHHVRVKVTIVGGAAYISTDRAGLKMIGVPKPVQRHDAGRWLKVRASDFTGFNLASLASKLTAYRGPLEPKVRQDTLDDTKVVVVSWQNGSKLRVANTGPAYPLREELKGQHPVLLEFNEYGAPLHVIAPRNAIDLSRKGF